MSLSSEDRNSIVLYRIERAYSTLDEAEMVANQGRYNLAANRLYYAVYYAASALLISNERPVKTHSGMISQMNLQPGDTMMKRYMIFCRYHISWEIF